MKSQVNRKTIIASFAWKLLERGSSQIVSFVVTLILARMLGPSEYGLVSLVVVFTSIALVFVQGGFNTALIQKKTVSEIDYSSVLIVSIVVACILYVTLFACAPMIALFYREEMVTPVLRVLSLTLVFGAFNSVQVAYATKRFMFRKLFVSNLIASVLSAAVGIFMAYQGAGVWAIVAQQLSNQLFVCFVLLALLRWCPQTGFSWESVRELFSFGMNVLLSNLMVSVFLNLRSLLVGRFYDSSTLGLFNRGRQFPSTVMEAVNGSLQTVMLPAFSELQDSSARVLSVARRSIRTSCFVTFPLVFGLSAVARPLVLVLLTEKWLGCVPYLQIFAISYVFQPTQIISAQALKGLGNSRTTLNIEALRKAVEFMLLIVSIRYSPLLLALSAVIAGLFGCIVAMKPNKALIGYTYRNQIDDCIRPLISSCIMYVVITMSFHVTEEPIMQLMIGVVIGIISYTVSELAMGDMLARETIGYISKLSERTKAKD